VMPAGVSPYTQTSKTLSFAVPDKTIKRVNRGTERNFFSVILKRGIMVKF